MFWDKILLWAENEQGTRQAIVTLERGFRMGLFLGFSPWSAWFDLELVCVRIHLWWGFRTHKHTAMIGHAIVTEPNQHSPVLGDNYEN